MRWSGSGDAVEMRRIPSRLALGRLLRRDELEGDRPVQQHVLGEAHAAHLLVHLVRVRVRVRVRVSNPNPNLLVHLVAPVEQPVAAQRAVERGRGEAGAARGLRRGAQLLELFAEGGRAALERRQAARVLRVASGEG